MIVVSYIFFFFCGVRYSQFSFFLCLMFLLEQLVSKALRFTGGVLLKELFFFFAS